MELLVRQSSLQEGPQEAMARFQLRTPDSYLLYLSPELLTPAQSREGSQKEDTTEGLLQQTGKTVRLRPSA